jgi:hypothetical protein
MQVTGQSAGTLAGWAVVVKTERVNAGDRLTAHSTRRTRCKEGLDGHSAGVIAPKSPWSGG